MGVPLLPVASALAGQLEEAERLGLQIPVDMWLQMRSPQQRSLTETLLSSNLIWKSLKALSHAITQAWTVQAKKQLFYI